jgi:hypothetical protein
VALDRVARSLSFVARTGTSPGDTDDMEFRILLAEVQVTGSQIVPTNVLYESSRVTVPLEFGGPFRDVTVHLGDTALIPGVTYAWIIDSNVEFDGRFGGGRIGLASSDYTGGTLIFRNPDLAGWTREDYLGVPWEKLQVDAAFTLTFVPEPSTASLICLGLAGTAIARRRTR